MDEILWYSQADTQSMEIYLWPCSAIEPEETLNLRGCRKTSICCVALILRHCSVLYKYASFLRISCALHLDIFQQPPYKWYSDSLQERFLEQHWGLSHL